MKFLLLALFLLAGSFTAFSQEDLRQTGIRYYRDGQYDRSIEYLTKAVVADKNDRSAWTYLGASYLKKGNEKEARTALLKTRSREIADDGPFGTELKLISRPRVPFSGVTGTVRLFVEFRSDGKIGFAFPIKVVFGLTDACVDATKRIQFTPATANGVPITVVRSVEYSVTIH